MALTELGRFDRTHAHLIVGLLEANDIPALAFDGDSSIADGSFLLIPVRVMVDEDDLEPARALLDHAA
jgi:hypothetical protein